MTDADIVELLCSRSGRAARVVTVEGESMEVQNVSQAEEPSNLADELHYYAYRGGLALTADQGRSFFYSNEVARVEDIETGQVLYPRDVS